MLQEERFEACQRVLLAKQAPDAVFAMWITQLKLLTLYFGKFFYQGFVDNEILLTIFTRRLILMPAYTHLEKLRHLKMRVAKQSWHTDNRCQHLCIESPTTISYQQVRLFFVYQLTNEADCLLRVHRQVRRKHIHTPPESITQSQSRHTLAAGKEAMKKQNLHPSSCH